jgi:hypothetical protein
MTLINHTYRFVFIHIPKNAGTSVSQYLSQVSTYRDIEVGATALGEACAPEYRRRYRLHKHSTFSDLERIMGPDELARFTTFAVLRDPFDRVRSIFTFLRTWKGWVDVKGYRRAAAEFERFKGVDDFVLSELFQSPGPDGLFLPQVTWITTDDPGVIRVDRLARFESLATDLANLVRVLGLPEHELTDRLRRANVSHASRWPRIVRSPQGPRQEMGDAAVERVRERYEPDFRLLETPARKTGR